MSKATPMQWPVSALPAAGPSGASRWLSRFIAMSLLAAVPIGAWVPWQQSVRGTGRVVAYAPLERRQAVEAPIDGRVREWFVAEGQQVQKGQPIADISDNDPKILRRLNQERNSIHTQIDAARLSISMTQAQIASLETARASAMANAGLRVQMARDRTRGAIRAVDGAQAALKTAELNLERQRALQSQGLTSQRTLELAELKGQTAHTDLDRAQASLSAAEAEVQALTAEQKRIASANAAGIESTRSSLEKLKADQAKMEGELSRVEVRLARQAQMQVLAPRAGTILQIVAKQGTEMVKAGDPLVMLVPDTEARAVEIYIDGNDAPLIDKGREVRLQFEGWPAVQFVGWPSVAVGTFAGRVDFVDSHDDGRGRFRIVVIPHSDQPWPPGRYLRQGVRANGWVLLNQVPMGFELWRNLNGFPPVLSQSGESSDKTGEAHK